MDENKKNKTITELEMLQRLREGDALLAPLRIREAKEWMAGMKRSSSQPVSQPDAVVVAGLGGDEEAWTFALEAKSRSTPRFVSDAIWQVRGYVDRGIYGMEQMHPMIYVPYLSPESLALLEKEQVSGIDLCGNGLIRIPGRLFILRTGQPNLYPDTRPVSNPYVGRSAMVARMLVSRLHFDSLNQLHEEIGKAGVDLSLSQVSKAVQTLKEQKQVTMSRAQGIRVEHPLELLEQLGREWRVPPIYHSKTLVLPGEVFEQLAKLNQAPDLKWSVARTSSLNRYTTFGQGGPLQVMVSDLSRAADLVQGQEEIVPSFADVQLLETDEPAYFFQNETDENGMRWASRLQTWIENRRGDARQQDAARDLKEQLLKGWR